MQLIIQKKIKTTCTTWPMNQKERSKLFHEKAEVEKSKCMVTN